MRPVAAVLTVLLLLGITALPASARAARVPASLRLRPEAHAPAFVVRNEGMFQFTATIDTDGTATLDKNSNFGCVHLLSSGPLSPRALRALLRLAVRVDFFELPRTVGAAGTPGDARSESVSIYTRSGLKTVDELPNTRDHAFDTVHSALMHAAGVSFDCA